MKFTEARDIAETLKDAQNLVSYLSFSWCST
jgi:hypothetical protein